MLLQAINSRNVLARHRSSCVIETDPAGIVTGANEGVARFLGASADTLVGRHVRDLLAARDGELFTLRALREDNVYFAGVEEIVVRGAVHRVWSTVSPTRQHGGTTGVVWTFVEPAEAGGEGTVTQQEREALIGRILAAVAHEIRNPLAAIKASAQLLENNDEDDATRSRLVSIINEQVERVEHVLHSFLLLSSHSRGTAGSVVLSEVLDEVRKQLHWVARSKEIELIVASDSDLPSVMADRADLLNVVVNLVRNALQSAPVNGRVELRAALVGDEVLLSVANDGPGLFAKQRDEMFDPAFATDTLSADIGLTISRRLVANHGGRIEVTSRPGKGYIFTVALPRTPAGVA